MGIVELHSLSELNSIHSFHNIELIDINSSWQLHLCVSLSIYHYNDVILRCRVTCVQRNVLDLKINAIFRKENVLTIWIAKTIKFIAIKNSDFPLINKIGSMKCSWAFYTTFFCAAEYHK